MSNSVSGALSKGVIVSAGFAGVVLTLCLLYGCSMSEEMRRIEEVRQAERQREEASNGNLNGEQLFIRSCNTCHPHGKQGVGPGLDKISEHFPDDVQLKKFIREGKNMMPGQPKLVINDRELDSLVLYLRNLQP